MMSILSTVGLLFDIHYMNPQASMQASQSNFLPSGSFKCVSANILAHYL